MKKRIFQILAIIFLCQITFSQTVTEINKDLKISDSLKFDKEIRIYKKISTTNGTEIFRIFEYGKNKWKVELYKYYNSTNNNEKSKFELTEIKAKSDLILVWLNLLISDVEYLPNLKDIKYKLKVSKIELEDGEYGISKRFRLPLDGRSYSVFVKNGKINNKIEFDNPDSYLEVYPEVDELKSYKELLTVLSNEFNIWEDK